MPTARQALNFTKAALEALPPAKPGQRDFYRDERLKGLVVLVTATGAKSFYLYKRVAGKPCHFFLGKHPDLTPENARKKCEAARGRAAMGEDLRATKRQEDQRRATLDDAFKAFKLARASLRATTVYGYERVIETALSAIKTKPLVALTPDGIAKLHRQLTFERGPAQADKALRVLRGIINFAQYHYEDADGQPLLPHNPVRRLSQTRAWNRVKRRQTYVKPDQLSRWFQAVLELKVDSSKNEYCTAADWLLLTILTGLRRNEGLSLRWSDVDLGNKTLTLRDTKNHEDHTLPLSDYVHELLSARLANGRPNPQTEELSDYVFASYGRLGHMVDPRDPLTQVIARSEVTFIPHDLRRTFITIAESLDIPAYALKRLLNHKMRQDVTAGYIVTDVERLRRPMQQVTDFILKRAGLRATASVSHINERALP